jgi:hypothetical protein
LTNYIIMAVVANLNFSYFLRLTWEFLDLESERGDSVCWPNNKIIDSNCWPTWTHRPDGFRMKGFRNDTQRGGEDVPCTVKKLLAVSSENLSRLSSRVRESMALSSSMFRPRWYRSGPRHCRHSLGSHHCSSAFRNSSDYLSHLSWQEQLSICI